MKVLFYGTPFFAAHILKNLIDNAANIVGVVTAPDKPAGRGHHMQASEVKKMALQYDIPVFQPTNLKSDDFQKILQSVNPDVQVVVAFRMLPEKVWSFPKKGTFNLHASLLPNYRGAAPINWAIINGEKRTGVTTFFLTHQIDTGEIIEQEACEISENETAGELHDKLMNLGSKLVISTLKKIELGKYSTIPQIELAKNFDLLKDAPKLDKSLCLLNANTPIQKLHDKIRGLSPFPGSFFNLKNGNDKKVLKIYATQVFTDKSPTVNPQFSISEKCLFFSNKWGSLKIIELQLEGKKRMLAKAFIQGFDIERWEIM